MRQKMAREEGHRHHQNSDWEHSDSPALSSCSTVLVCGGRIGRQNVLVVIAGSEGPRLRHVATPSCARAEDRLVGIQKVVAAAHVPADGIAATGASPPKIAGPVGNTIATTTHPYPLPQVIACRSHLAAEGYRSREPPAVAFIDQCGDLTVRGKEDEEVGSGGCREDKKEKVPFEPYKLLQLL